MISNNNLIYKFQKGGEFVEAKKQIVFLDSKGSEKIEKWTDDEMCKLLETAEAIDSDGNQNKFVVVQCGAGC